MIFSGLNPLRRMRARRLEQYREIENHEWMSLIEARVKNRDEKEREIDLAVHNEGRTGINWLANREIRMTALVLASQRELIPARIEIRKRLGEECPELLSDAEILKLEESMLRSVRTSRAARRGDYKRRAQAAGLPMHRPEQQDAGEYGALEALIRRQTRQLILDRMVGRKTVPKQAFLEVLKKIWIDPVWSKVISWGIIGLLVLAGGAIGQHFHWWAALFNLAEHTSSPVAKSSAVPSPCESHDVQYVPPKGKAIRFEGSYPIASETLCPSHGLSEDARIACLCPNRLPYTLRALPPPTDSNFATEITISKVCNPMYKVRVFLKGVS